MKQMYLAYGVRAGREHRLPPPPLSAILKSLGCQEHRTKHGLGLFTAGDLPVRKLTNGRGWVIGHLFDKSGLSAPDELDRRIFDIETEAIVDRFWGDYVALIADAGVIRVLRDPSGGLACYHALIDDVVHITSSPHLLIDAGIIKADLDWNVIAKSLSEHAVRDSETALRGIAELLPGRAMKIGTDDVSIQSIWNPWLSAARSVRSAAASSLGEVLISTLAAWGRRTRRPLIEVSGGLDSAIVAAGIAPVAEGASLISFAAAQGDPDETLYARALAQYLGLQLEIAHPCLEDVDLTRSLSQDLPRPNARAFVQAADLQSLQHARAIGADAFFSGGGGDDVFCYLRTILPAIDRMRAEGIRAMLETAGDIAVMNHANIWDALLRVARRVVRGTSRKSKIDRLFLARCTHDGGNTDRKESVRTDRPGKAAHVEAVLSIHNYLEGHARTDFAPIHSPLLSQPIVECCLSIPTWLWCKGGRNRAVARDAFAEQLPSILLERRSKGSFDGFCAHLLDANRKLIGDMLMDGILAKHEIIAPDIVMLALQDPFPPPQTIGRILSLVDAEAWAASWTTRYLQRS